MFLVSWIHPIGQRSLNKWLLNVQDAVSIEMMIIEPSLEILLGPSEQKSPLGSCALTAG